MNKAIASEHLDPTFWQEAHSPTESVQVRFRTGFDPTTGKPKEITIGTARRRVKDAEIWKSFTSAQESAANRLGEDRMAKIGAMAMKSCSLETRVSGNPIAGMSDRLVAAIKRYDLWQDECKRQNVNALIAVFIVCEGANVRETMRTYRRGHEYVRTHLMDGVDLYAKMFGA